MGAKRIILSLGIVVIALFPSTASAGGWWNGLDLVGQAIGVGESFSFRSEVLFPDIETAEAAHSADYRAYLVRGMDHDRLDKAMGRAEPGDWWSVPKKMIQIGTVSFSRRDANLSTATAHLNVPEVPSGTYNLMLCSPGCVEPVGNLFPLKVRVSPDPVVATKVRRLTEKTWDLKTTLAGTKRDLRRSNRKLILAEPAAEGGNERVSERADATVPTGETTPWWHPAMWFVSGALLTLVLNHLRLRKRGGSPAPLEAQT